MIVRMAKVRVLGPRARLPDTIRVVQDVGVLHLATPPEGPLLLHFPLPPSEARRRVQLNRILEDIERTLSKLESPGTSGPTVTVSTKDLANWARLANRIRRKVDGLEERTTALEEERALLARYGGFFRAFETLLRTRGVTPGASAFHVVLRADQAATLPRLQEALRQVLGDASASFTQKLPGGEVALLLLVPGATAQKVDQLLAQTGVQEIPVPTRYGASMLEAIPKMRERETALPRELEALQREYSDLARRYGPELVRARSGIRDRLLQLDALPLSGVTPHAFVIEGWLPTSAETRLANTLDRSFGGEVVVETIGSEHWKAEEAPVVLRNPRLFRPFEMLTRLVPLPRYGTLDPTPFVAVFFPMFFGLMLGDAGYGAVLAALAALLHRRSRPGSNRRSISEVAGASALFSIIFGILFGEYFGDLGRRWLGIQPLWLNREEAIIPFLALALALGLVHITLGLVLGALSARDNPRLALGRGMSAVMILLILFAILAAVEVLPRRLLSPAVIALLVSFPVLIVVEGLLAPIELLSTIGHILSYARIMALGTASVMLAIVANQMAGAMGSVVVGVLFALLFHLVNFGLAIFSPTIHALRLHFVEFFGTFYSPGGVRYQPLGHWSHDAGRTA
ncbi:MAG TPA: V-type ATPase 116kDa subunit family protein [Gemmatimonadales bacterium]